MKKEVNASIGARIRKKREALGMTRERLAEKADLSAQFLAEVELGKKGVYSLTIKKLCDTLHVSADYLIRNRELSTEFPVIIELLSNLDSAYIPLVEELLRTYVKTVDFKKTEN